MDIFLQFWRDFAGSLVQLLPTVPLIDDSALSALSRYAGYINYFFPMGALVNLMLSFLGLIGSYYIVMAVLRFMRLVR